MRRIVSEPLRKLLARKEELEKDIEKMEKSPKASLSKLYHTKRSLEVTEQLIASMEDQIAKAQGIQTIPTFR